MSVYAFENGRSVLNETNMNALLKVFSSSDIYEGAAKDSKSGAGVSENSVADYSYAIRVQAVGVTEINRITLEVDKDGVGTDLSIDILDADFNSDGSNEGTVLASVLIPKEFLATTASVVSIPVNVTGLTSNQYIWIRVNRAGDLTNKLDLIGEASQDASYPAYYRVASSGAWFANNAIHFIAYAGRAGELKHTLYESGGHETYEFTGDDLTKVYYYLPYESGEGLGLRQIEQITWDGEYLVSTEVT